MSGLAWVLQKVGLSPAFSAGTNEKTKRMIMKKTLNLFLAGSVLAVGTASAQLAPAPQQERQPGQAPQQEAQPAPRQNAPQQSAPQAAPQERAPQQDPEEVQAKLEALHQELEKISIRLSEIHQEALLDADVRKLLVEYESSLTEKIRDAAPGLGEQVDAHEKVLEDISDVGKDGDDISSEEKEELEQLLAQHGELKQQLAPIENQLLNDPEMREARSEYQEELIAAMNEVDPKVEEIIAERMELAQNFMALQQQYLQSQQSLEGQQPGQQGGQAPQRGQAPRPGQ